MFNWVKALLVGTAATGTTTLLVSDEEQRKAMFARMRYGLVNHSFSRAAASLQTVNFNEHTSLFLGLTRLAECQFSDKHLAGALDKVDKGIGELMKKYPGRKKPNIKSGLRGPKYFIELPITGKDIDAFSLVLSTERLLQEAKDK